MSDADRVREARDELMLRVPGLSFELGRLDAYAEAIRAECDAAWRAAIEGMRREHDLDCALRTPLPASGTVSCALTCSCPAGERNALLARLSAIDAARASEPRGSNG